MNLLVRRLFAMGTVFALLLVSCGGETTPGSAAKSTKSGERLKVAFVYPGPIADNGWTHSHNAAREKMVERIGADRVEAAYVENAPYTEEMTQIFEQFYQKGYKVLVDSGTSGELFKSVCRAHKDAICLTTDGQPPIESNVVAFYPKHWETTYLIGMAAGMLTKTDTIGYVGGFPVPTIIANANAMQLGCYKVNPNCVVRVTFIDSWYDPKKATESANTLADAGADVLYNTVDDPSALTVAQQKGLWGAGAYQPQLPAGPDAYITADIWDWSNFYTSEVEKILAGTWKGGRLEHPSVEDGGLYLDQWGPRVPANVKDAVMKVFDQMKTGVNVFVGPIYDQSGKLRVAPGKALDDAFLYGQWKWLVKGTIGQT